MRWYGPEPDPVVSRNRKSELGGKDSVYGDPRTSSEWQDVASERSTDASVLRDGQRVLAELYMLGLVVECYAKALCVEHSGDAPKGSAGHDLITILEQAGFGRMDLPPDCREFAESRDVALRYQVALPHGVDAQEQLNRGRELARWCKVRLNRPSRRRR